MKRVDQLESMIRCATFSYGSSTRKGLFHNNEDRFNVFQAKCEDEKYHTEATVASNGANFRRRYSRWRYYFLSKSIPWFEGDNSMGPFFLAKQNQNASRFSLTSANHNRRMKKSFTHPLDAIAFHNKSQQDAKADSCTPSHTSTITHDAGAMESFLPNVPSLLDSAYSHSVTSVRSPHHRKCDAFNKQMKDDLEPNFSSSLNPLAPPISFFVVVCDGHDGSEAAEFVSKSMYNCFIQQWKIQAMFSNDLFGCALRSYKSVFRQMEEQFRQLVSIPRTVMYKSTPRCTAGTCVVSVCCMREYIFCANLGDCGAVLLTLSLSHLNSDVPKNSIVEDTADHPEISIVERVAESLPTSRSVCSSSYEYGNYPKCFQHTAHCEANLLQEAEIPKLTIPTQSTQDSVFINPKPYCPSDIEESKENFSKHFREDSLIHTVSNTKTPNQADLYIRHLSCENNQKIQHHIEKSKTSRKHEYTETYHFQRLSQPHRATQFSEVSRIRSLGGIVVNNRFEGLEPTRTIGDFDVKDKQRGEILSCEPEVTFVPLTGPGLVIIASDGVWDALSPEKIIHSLRKKKKRWSRLRRCLLNCDMEHDHIKSLAGELNKRYNIKNDLAAFASQLTRKAVTTTSDDSTCILVYVASNNSINSSDASKSLKATLKDN